MPYFCLPFSPFPFSSSTSSKWTGKTRTSSRNFRSEILRHFQNILQKIKESFIWIPVEQRVQDFETSQSSFLKHFVPLVLRNYSVREYSVRYCCCSWFSIVNYCLSFNNTLVAIEMRCISQVQVTWEVLSFRKVGSCWRK